MGVGSSVLGGVGGSTAGSSGTAIADYGSNFQFNAKGGVYSSSDLSAYSGQVVDNPISSRSKTFLIAMREQKHLDGSRRLRIWVSIDANSTSPPQWGEATGL